MAERLAEDVVRWLEDDTDSLPRRAAVRELRVAVAVPDLRFAVRGDRDAEREGECARFTVDLVMVACAGVCTELMRAAPADVATSVASERTMRAARTIGGTRRNQSMLSVRRSGVHLEF